MGEWKFDVVPRAWIFRIICVFQKAGHKSINIYTGRMADVLYKFSCW
jgi:hypothetical protein